MKITLLLVFLSGNVFAAKYKRSLFRHWIDEDRDCQNQRQEILIERSLVPVVLNKKGCLVVAGKWNDFFYPEVHTLSKKVDIDHIVPLKHAFDLGAGNWNKKLRKQFANDPANLVITNRRYNRQKGAKSIAKWLPINRSYACRYIKKWMQVKKKYKLTISKEELNTQSVAKCEKIALPSP